jgi:ABC-type transport system substrate-binding protein
MNPLNKKFSVKDFLSWIKDLTKKQLVYLSLGLLVLILIIFFTVFYFKNSEIVPREGGSYTEGIIGTPRFLNPVYSFKSETDRGLTNILFAGLMKYDKDNELVPDLAKSIETENDQNFRVVLKESLWSDGEKITAKDVIFTVKAIQNREVQSPLRVSWEGIQVTKIDEKTVEFTLESPSPLFLEKLTLKPIPEHIWETIPYSEFQFTDYNLKPIVSGPYKLAAENKNISENLDLIINDNYFGSGPYLEEITFLFFESEESLIENKNRLDAFGVPSITNKVSTPLKEHRFLLPRYFALFFNLDHFEKNIREALTYATDKKEILKPLENIEMIDSAMLPDFYDLNDSEVENGYDKQKAINILEENYQKNEDGYYVRENNEKFYFTERLSINDQGEEVRMLQRCFLNLNKDYPELFPNGEVTGYFQEETETAVNTFQEIFREDILAPHGFTNPTGVVASSTQGKLNEICNESVKNEILSVKITTINHPLLSIIVEELSSNWEEIGIKVDKEIIDLQQVEKKVIEQKNFEAFLFGISLQSLPDHYRWWHSSQINNPGLNFTNYQDEEADQYLEKSITSSSKEERLEALENLQNKLLTDKPAIFFYSPNYIYMLSRKIKGLENKKIINSAQRFKNINNWYINSKRIWKKN